MPKTYSGSGRKLVKNLSDKDAKRIWDVFVYVKENLSDTLRRSGKSYFQHSFESALVLKEAIEDVNLMIVILAHDLLIHENGKNLLKRAPLNKEGKHLAEKMHKLRGLHKWRYEIEDTCFRLLHKRIANNLEKRFLELKKTDELCLKHAVKFIQKKLNLSSVNIVRIETRIKSLYSTYRKMKIKNRDFTDLTDRLALRIIVKSMDDCYRTLGVVHQFMHPIPGKLKDYIGLPKGNGYRSIHTVVYPLSGVTEQPIEIQIRMENMHLECEYGAVAHYDYKHQNYSIDVVQTRVNIFRNLEVLKAEKRSPKIFEQALRTYFSEQNLVVFDENDSLYYLEKPSTALDFAVINYAEKIEFLDTIRINGRKERVQTLLKDGDVISVTFGKKKNKLQNYAKILKRKRAKEVLKKTEEEIKKHEGNVI